MRVESLLAHFGLGGFWAPSHSAAQHAGRNLAVQAGCHLVCTKLDGLSSGLVGQGRWRLRLISSSSATGPPCSPPPAIPSWRGSASAQSCNELGRWVAPVCRASSLCSKMQARHSSCGPALQVFAQAAARGRAAQAAKRPSSPAAAPVAAQEQQRRRATSGRPPQPRRPALDTPLAALDECLTPINATTLLGPGLDGRRSTARGGGRCARNANTGLLVGFFSCSARFRTSTRHKPGSAPGTAHKVGFHPPLAHTGHAAASRRPACTPSPLRPSQRRASSLGTLPTPPLTSSQSAPPQRQPSRRRSRTAAPQRRCLSSTRLTSSSPNRRGRGWAGTAGGSGARSRRSPSWSKGRRGRAGGRDGAALAAVGAAAAAGPAAAGAAAASHLLPPQMRAACPSLAQPSPSPPALAAPRRR